MNMTTSWILAAAILLSATSAQCVELPKEQPLWGDADPPQEIRYDVDERVRSNDPPLGSPSGSNRVFSFVSKPTFSVHRPDKPNGVGLVICPGGGYRDVWLDREGHDLAILLAKHNITSLVLKYRTNSSERGDHKYSWDEYLPAVQADAKQAIRVLRMNASELGLDRHKIGIGGFSAGGNLALLSTLHMSPKNAPPDISDMPDFAALYYPWFREDYSDVIERRTSPDFPAQPICPIYIINARDDALTPTDRCIEFYTTLLKAGVNAELHIFNKGGHGFDLATGRSHAAAKWPDGFVAWLRDVKMIE